MILLKFLLLTKDEMPTVLLRPSHESLNTEMVDLEKDGVKFNVSLEDDMEAVQLDKKSRA